MRSPVPAKAFLEANNLSFVVQIEDKRSERRVKIRAASEGRKLKEIIAELLEKGMETPPAETLPEGELPYYRHPKTGFLVSRTLGTAGGKKVSLAESLAAIEQASCCGMSLEICARSSDGFFVSAPRATQQADHAQQSEQRRRGLGNHADPQAILLSG